MFFFMRTRYWQWPKLNSLFSLPVHALSIFPPLMSNSPSILSLVLCWPRSFHLWMKSLTWATNVRSQPRRPIVSWAPSGEASPAGRERWFCPSTLLWWDLTWSIAFSSGALSTRTWNCWSRSKGGLQKWSEGWSSSPMRTGWESWACSAWRREGCGETWLQPFST